MPIYELQTLARMFAKAYEEFGYVSLDYFTDNPKHTARVMLARGTFEKFFGKNQPIKELIVNEIYGRIKVVDDVEFLTLISKDNLTKEDKEELEWFGLLKK